jgi:CheY-like chemotaxis protein
MAGRLSGPVCEADRERQSRTPLGEACLAAGMNDFITKPVNLAALYEACRSGCRAVQLGQRIELDL